MARQDPFRNSRYLLEIDGINQAGFSECAIGDTTTDVIEYREGDEAATPRKLQGLTKFGNVTLKWGLGDRSELWDWRQQVVDGQMGKARRNGSIIVLDEEGNEAARWNFFEGWPSKYDPSDYNATGNEVAVETLEISHERLERG